MPTPDELERMQRWHAGLLVFIESFRGRADDAAIDESLDLAGHNENQIALEFLSWALDPVWDVVTSDERTRLIALVNGFVHPSTDLPDRLAEMSHPLQPDR